MRFIDNSVVAYYFGPPCSYATVNVNSILNVCVFVFCAAGHLETSIRHVVIIELHGVP